MYVWERTTGCVRVGEKAEGGRHEFIGNGRCKLGRGKREKKQTK